MKRIVSLFCCAAIMGAVTFSGCCYKSQTEKLLNVPVDNYKLIFETDGNVTEVVAAESSMRIYYFNRNTSGYDMKSGSLISEFLYSDIDRHESVENIHYSFDSRSITVNEVFAEEVTLNYEEFKAYCLEYFGDSEDKQFKSDICNLVKECLSVSVISQIQRHNGILGDNNMCYSSVKLSYLGSNEVYLGIIKKRLNDEEYQYFTDTLSESSTTTQKNVSLEIFTDSNYEFIYPVIALWHKGVYWFNIYLFNHIS